MNQLKRFIIKQSRCKSQLEVDELFDYNQQKLAILNSIKKHVKYKHISKILKNREDELTN